MKIKPVLIIFSFFLLLGCNGNDSGSFFGDIAEGGIGGTGKSDGGIGGTGKSEIHVGPISSFGSIFVNGIEFDTNNAVILIDGQPMTENDLQIGMVVRIESTTENGKNQALQVYFNENVRGPIQALDKNTLIVLGQTVILEQQTVFDGDKNDLKVGDIVNVSGLNDANGAIRATWMTQEQELQEFELVGPITNMNLAAQTFMIGAITIDYSQPQRFDVADPQNGLLVEVKGNYSNEDNVLMASSVEPEIFEVDSGTLIEIEGFITQFNDALDFKVDQFPVTTNLQTVFQYGNVNDLGSGVKVEVKGQLNTDGILVLEEVDFLDIASQRTPEGRIDIEADIEAIEGNEITLLGLSVKTTQSTQFRDKRDGVVPYGVSQLQIGDRVAISGFLDLTTNTLIAEILLREPSNEQIEITGPTAYLNIEENTFTILGIPVITDENTVYEDESLGGTEVIINAGLFLPNLQQSLIEVQGIFTNGVILATRLEIED
jgi:hypothetical protein